MNEFLFFNWDHEDNDELRSAKIVAKLIKLRLKTLWLANLWSGEE